jgi:hypothetical protein
MAHQISSNSFVFVTHLGHNVHMVNVDASGVEIECRYRQAKGINVLSRDEVTRAWSEGLASGGYRWRLTQMKFAPCGEVACSPQGKRWEAPPLNPPAPLRCADVYGMPHVPSNIIWHATWAL